MMLTSDIALLHDPSYLQLVKSFAADEAAFNEVFSQGELRILVGKEGLSKWVALACELPAAPYPWWRL